MLSESTTGKLSYTDLSRILSELIRANAYIIDAQGRVLGVGYTNAEDTSTYTDELGFEKIPEANNRNLLKLTETQVNLLGEELKAILGEDYPLTDKYHMFIPSVCGRASVWAQSCLPNMARRLQTRQSHSVNTGRRSSGWRSSATISWQ